MPANRTKDFIWNLFPAHYVEMAKARAYGKGFSEEEKRAARQTLHTCLRTILLLLAPIAPFITDKIWMSLYGGGSIHQQGFPDPEWDPSYTENTQSLTEFNSTVWATKKELGLSLRDSIEISVPEDLELFQRDLTAMHNLNG